MIKILHVAFIFALLLEIWHKTHWSVALFCLLTFITVEANAINIKKLRAERAERSKVEWKIFNKIKKLSKRTDEINKKSDYVRDRLTTTTKRTTDQAVRSAIGSQK